MPGSFSWMPYAPQGVKEFDDDDVQPTRNARNNKIFGTHNLKTFPYWPNARNVHEDCDLRVNIFSFLKDHK